MNEKPEKSDICLVDEGDVKAVQKLHESGYSYKDIAKILDLSRTQVFRIVNKKYKIKKYKRCEKCGRLIKYDYCIGCKLKEELKDELEDELEGDVEESSDPTKIELELKDQDYKRYLKVKEKKLKELDERAKEKLEWLERKRN